MRRGCANRTERGPITAITDRAFRCLRDRRHRITEPKIRPPSTLLATPFPSWLLPWPFGYLYISSKCHYHAPSGKIYFENNGIETDVFTKTTNEKRRRKVVGGNCVVSATSIDDTRAHSQQKKI